MAKFYGVIGYVESVETAPGIWGDKVTELMYYGDVISDNTRFQSSDKVNDNLVVSNKISIVADTFANKNFPLIRYVEYMGAKWKVTTIETLHPRLIITLGGLYNGN